MDLSCRFYCHIVNTHFVKQCPNCSCSEPPKTEFNLRSPRQWFEHSRFKNLLTMTLVLASLKIFIVLYTLFYFMGLGSTKTSTLTSTATTKRRYKRNESLIAEFIRTNSNIQTFDRTACPPYRRIERNNDTGSLALVLTEDDIPKYKIDIGTNAKIWMDQLCWIAHLLLSSQQRRV